MAAHLGILLFISGIFAVYGFTFNDVEDHRHFDVKPGGEVHVMSSKLDDVECVFTYKAQGGTSERWGFIVGANNAKTGYSCMLERPNHESYLYFEQFHIQMKSPDKKLKVSKEESKAIAHGNEPLGADEIAFSNTDMKSVTGRFKNSLAHLKLVSLKKPSGEL